MGFELGLEKNNLLGNGIRTPPPPPLHDPLIISIKELYDIGVQMKF